MSDCATVIDELFQENLVNDFAEMPSVFWDRPNCQGNRWPVEGDHTPFDQTLAWSRTGLPRLASFYIPPHATAKIESANGGALTLMGVSSDTSKALLQTWDTVTGEPCPSTSALHDCGRRIDWGGIARFRIARHRTWNDHVMNKAIEASQNGTYEWTHGGRTYQPDWDLFMNRYCSETPTPNGCQCYVEWRSLIQSYPTVDRTKLYVGFLDGTCQPQKHFISKRAPKGTGSSTECNDLVFALTQAGAPPSTNIQCSNRTVNAASVPNLANKEEEAHEDGAQSVSVVLVVAVCVMFVIVLWALWTEWGVKNSGVPRFADSERSPGHFPLRMTSTDHGRNRDPR